uniref:Uncharacterized protein n=1 Tax=Anopheles farauti TaxID=69004 RepID=A0A182QHK2_9DIPT
MMFTKPFKIKSNIPVTASKKKRLLQRVLEQFNQVQSVEEANGSMLVELFGSRAKVCTVKIITFDEQPVTVYTSDKRPIFFELDEKLLPTVYTLWSCPDLVPMYTTHATVMPKLAKGADLLIMGVVKQGPHLAWWESHQQHEVVAVNLTLNRAAIGVGLLAYSSSELKYTCKVQDVCVKMMHVFGDKLWGMETSLCQQVPQQGPVFSDLSISSSQPSTAEEDQHETKTPTPAPEGSSRNPDDLIKGALIKALKMHGKNMTLPMHTSTFYPQYVLPHIPEGIEMKKSSYKKVGTFLKWMADEGIIEIMKDEKGIEKVTVVNLEHPEVLSLSSPDDTGKTTLDENANSVPIGVTTATSNRLLLTKMAATYAVNERSAKLFGYFNVALDEELEQPQVRSYMHDYVKQHGLINPDTRHVMVDEALREACGTEHELIDMSDLIEMVLNRMTSSFEMESQQGPITTGGKWPIIRLKKATRNYNKKVTLVSNLQYYGINVNDLMKVMKLEAAASTAMTEMSGWKGEQLQVQGNHIELVYELLTTTQPLIMFIKPFKIKSNILVTGSEKKRLRQRVMAQFHRTDEGETAGSPLAELFGNRAKVCTVKIITYHEEPVTVYTSDKRPIFFELNGKLLPTVYTLWSCPDLVPLFTTHATVLPKLANGADLMIPGVVKQGTNLASWGRHQKDDIVAVNLTSNRAAVGVGLLAHSSSDLYMCGGHGVCVKMMHVFGDKLWGMEPSVCQQVPLQGSVVSVPTASDFPPLGSEKVKPVVESVNEVTKSIESTALHDKEGSGSDGDASDGEESPEPEPEEKPPNPDDLIKGAFLNALKLHGKKITLPLLTSTFYPQYVQPEIPEGVEMKKSSYKKVGTFLKKMADDGIIEIKEEKKGIEKVTALNLEHPDVLSFYPYRATKAASDQEANGGSAAGGATSNPLLLTQMTAMYAVNERTAKLFGCFNVGVGKTLDQTQVRNYMRDYVGRNKLINPTTKLVTLDETLRDICGTEEELVAMSDLTETVLNSMTSTFEMRSQKGAIMKSGKRAVIHLTTATRSGNKKVTLISNLADYGINVNDFAKAVKLGAAASTTMTEVPGSKGEQLMVQGNHIKFVFELLTTTYQVPKACITGLEFAKEQKKKKKK